MIRQIGFGIDFIGRRINVVFDPTIRDGRTAGGVHFLQLLVVEEELLEHIDDFRFDNRIGSRSEAVRQLIKAGLKKKLPKKKK